MRLTLLPAFVLAGIVHAQPTAETPHCVSARECEVMWSKAQRAIGILSNMRIRLLTDVRIETFSPIGYGTVGAVVTKVPSEVDDGYDINLELQCYVKSTCEKLSSNAQQMFNQLLRKVPRPGDASPTRPANEPSS